MVALPPNRSDASAWCATKIIATLGPATSEVAVLRSLLRAGMTVARLNFSHGTYTHHEQLLNAARQAQREEGAPLAILLDLRGPEVRTLNQTSLHLTEGAIIRLRIGAPSAAARHHPPSPAEVLPIGGIRTLAFLRKGMRVLLNDGAQCLRVVEEGEKSVLASVEVGGTIGPRRGVQFPDASTTLQGLTAQDARDIAWGAKMGVDAIAVSFVKTKQDLRRARSLLRRYHSPALLIAKIETKEAVDHITDIVREADGIMVARGDLALAVPSEEVPLLQKELVALARREGKFAIVATQMLESMVHNPSPTRAELSDVANAVLDGADALMLSAETAVGQHAIRAVTTMRQVALAAQRFKEERKELFSIPLPPSSDVKQRISTQVAAHAMQLAQRAGAAAVVAFTETGATARLISRSQGPIPILVVSQHSHTLRQALFGYGLVPLRDPVRYSRRSSFVSLARAAAAQSGFVRKGDPILIVSGSIFGQPGETNTLSLITL